MSQGWLNNSTKTRTLSLLLSLSLRFFWILALQFIASKDRHEFGKIKVFNDCVYLSCFSKTSPYILLPEDVSHDHLWLQERQARNNLVFYPQSWEKDKGEEWFVGSTILSRILQCKSVTMKWCECTFLTDIWANQTINKLKYLELGSIQITHHSHRVDCVQFRTRNLNYSTYRCSTFSVTWWHFKRQKQIRWAHLKVRSMSKRLHDICKCYYKKRKNWWLVKKAVCSQMTFD